MFPARNAMLLDHLRPIIELLRSDRRLRLWFCDTSDPPDRFLTSSNDLRISRHRILPYWIARRVRWDLVIYSQHERYFRSASPKIYVGHGIVSGPKMADGAPYPYGRYSRSGKGKLLYQKIFVSSAYIREQIAHTFPDHAARTEVVGSLIAERVLGTARRHMFAADPDRDRRKTVMIVSSWGPRSLLQAAPGELCKAVAEIAARYDVIMSCHPNNFTGPLAPDLDLLGPFRKLARASVFVDEDPKGSLRLLPSADVLVTDFSSIGLIYTVLERPIVYVDMPGVDYHELAMIRLLQSHATVSRGVLHLHEDIARAFAEFDPTRAAALKARLFDDIGHASEKYVREIYDTLNMSPPRMP